MPHEFRMIETNGVKIRAAVEGAGPLVVMVHGWPESWYSWRHQMAPLAAAGYTACAIDVRGYGGSDKPHPKEAYDMQAVTGDVAGVIDALSPGKPAVLFGHDWGAPIVWHTALLHPDKVRAVCGMSVPYRGYPDRPLTEMLDKLFTQQGRFFYIAYFQTEGPAEKEFESDLEGALRRLYFSASGDFRDINFTMPEKKVGDTMTGGLPNPDPFPAWLSAADIAYFVGEFKGSGLRGPINRYRNFERDHAYMAGRDPVIHQPALFIGGERDGVLGGGTVESLTADMKPHFDNLMGVHLVPKAGHWNQQESPEATTRLMLDWLKALPPA
jgi:pimeloyl-ACP methyl ester carboxylesterase